MGVLSRLRGKLRVLRDPEPDRRAPPPRPAAWADDDDDPDSPRGDQAPNEYIASFVRDNHVAIFMKGSPDAPRCGFSAKATAILREHGVPFAHFDVLSDEDVRDAVKDFSSWPTIPQVYVGGQFLGGSDIVAQLHESGELATMLGGGGDAGAAPS